MTMPPAPPSIVDLATPPEGEWLAIEDAAALIGRSTRHIFRLGNAALIRSKLGPQPKPGAKHRVLYSKADLLLQRNVHAPNLQKMAPGAFDETMQGSSLLASPAAALELIKGVIPEIFRQWQTMTHDTIAPHEYQNTPHKWLTLDQAAAYCQASKARLLKAAHSGVLVAIKDGAWKIRQSSLDTWDGETEAAPDDAKAGRRVASAVGKAFDKPGKRK